MKFVKNFWNDIMKHNITAVQSTKYWAGILLFGLFGISVSCNYLPLSTMQNPKTVNNQSSRPSQSSVETVANPKAESSGRRPSRADSDQVALVSPGSAPTDQSPSEETEYAVSPDALSHMQAALDEALEYCKASQSFWQQGKFENAIQALDQAYALLLEADAGSDSDLIQQKEDIRFLISKRILEIYASRHTIVNGSHEAIPITINEDVEKEIQRYTTGQGRKFFIEAYRRSGKYLPLIKKKLKEAGLPAELAWLPLIESGFKPKALSQARALGLWQFIPSTGYKFGLERNVYIDERLDPEKSTDAAISYLKTLHQIFGDWETVLAAYNCGEGRVLRVIRTKNINYLDNFWDLYQQLPWETARYVPKFLATLHILANLQKYKMTAITPDPPIEYDRVKISRRIHLKNIASAIGISYDALKELNPELRHQILPGDTYHLRVPKGKKATLLARLKTIPTSSPPQKKFVYHRIRRGESLSAIAQKYRTTMTRIARANNIYRYNHITAGKLLKIPLGHNWAPTPAINAGNGPVKHVVRRGESLWIIAKQYGTTVKNIQQANNLKTTRLLIGQTLNIPNQGHELRSYQVKKGDSPFLIALRHNMSLEQFLALNNLTPKNIIYPGQTVYVK